MTKNKPCILCNRMTLFPRATENYTRQLHSIENRRQHHLRAVEHFNHICTTSMQQSAMPTSSNSEIHIEYSPAIKEKIAKKKKLRKLWQTNRCPLLKNKLNRAIKTLKNLLEMEKNQEIQEYLSKLSAWNQLLSMESYKKTEVTADTLPAY